MVTARCVLQGLPSSHHGCAWLHASTLCILLQIVYVETISNPTCEVPDLPAVVRLAQQAKALAIIDNTFASPANYRWGNRGHVRRKVLGYADRHNPFKNQMPKTRTLHQTHQMAKCCCAAVAADHRHVLQTKLCTLPFHSMLYRVISDTCCYMLHFLVQADRSWFRSGHRELHQVLEWPLRCHCRVCSWTVKPCSQGQYIHMSITSNTAYTWEAQQSGSRSLSSGWLAYWSHVPRVNCYKISMLLSWHCDHLRFKSMCCACVVMCRFESIWVNWEAQQIHMHASCYNGASRL